jgi:3-oxoadipate enol-lactonase
MTDLWYEDLGTGPPVVLLHEGVVDSRIWDRVVSLLAAELRVIRYDQRGYGRSPMWTEPYSPVDDLFSVVDAAGVERAVLVGASRGGRIALEAVLERPDRVSALVLVGSGLSGHPLDLDVTPEQEARWASAEATADYTAMAELDMEFWAPLGTDERLRTMFVDNARASNSDDPAVELEAASRLGEIRVPTLIVTGARDVAAMTDIGDLLRREIADAESAVIEDADHMIPWRCPRELSDLVLRFLRNVSDDTVLRTSYS